MDQLRPIVTMPADMEAIAVGQRQCSDIEGLGIRSGHYQ
jgi:hypothetical protein